VTAGVTRQEKGGEIVKIFVLNADKTPLMPCYHRRAIEMLKTGRAAVYRRVPFTIILKEYRNAPITQPVELRVDPGSKTTGLALVSRNTVIFAANLVHRGEIIHKRLQQRAAYRRRRRTANLRYRQARFNNRTRQPGWLPPSLQSRVDNITSWASLLSKRVPLTSIAVETVRFDLQKLVNPEISGVEYQQGELFGYEVREYLLEKWHRACAYCDAQNVPLEIDHIVPRSAGGSNRISNLTLACRTCNDAKGSQPIEVFLAHDPERLARILAHRKTPLKDAAAVNATRYAIGNALKAFGLPTTFWSGGRTKMNRVKQGYEKDHWIDAACVGESGANVTIPFGIKAITIRAIGRGTRQVRKTDDHGFPRGGAKRTKDVRGFRSGDIAKLNQPSGKYAGTYVGIVTVRARGHFDIATARGKITAPFTRFTLLQRSFGYAVA
jgi:5-methylcytosine-specific restriction endonuclease McrA